MPHQKLISTVVPFIAKEALQKLSEPVLRYFASSPTPGLETPERAVCCVVKHARRCGATL